MKEIKMDWDTYQAELETRYDDGYEDGKEYLLKILENENYTEWLLKKDFADNDRYSFDIRFQNIIKKFKEPKS